MIRSRFWLAAAIAYVVVLLATLPVAPRIWLSLPPGAEEKASSWFMAAGVAAVCVFVAKVFQFEPEDRRRSLVVLCVAALLFVATLQIFYAGVAPAKKFHVLQYGVLAWVLFSAVRIEPPHTRGIWFAVLSLLTVGVLDECIQAILPRRFFGVKDIVGNWAGVGMGFMCWVATSALSPWRSDGQRD